MALVRVCEPDQGMLGWLIAVIIFSLDLSLFYFFIFIFIFLILSHFAFSSNSTAWHVPTSKLAKEGKKKKKVNKRILRVNIMK